MRDSNKKFEGFAHTLIAESLKKWANHSKFVAAKLEQRLQAPIDELDEKIAEVIFAGNKKEQEKKAEESCDTPKSKVSKASTVRSKK